MPKIKVMKMVEVEINGDELIAKLRETAGALPTVPFIVGDIVGPDTPANRDNFDSEKIGPRPAFGIVLEVRSDDGGEELNVGFFKDDGDWEEMWLDCDGMVLIESAPRPQITPGTSSTSEAAPDWTASWSTPR